jgi:3-methyladenine DNA glycosylase AlkD
VAQTTMARMTVAEVMTELAALEEPKAREVNARHGDDHGVNLSKLRSFAKRLGTHQELAWLGSPILTHWSLVQAGR